MAVNKGVKKLLYITVILSCSSSQIFSMNMNNSTIQNNNRLGNNNPLVNNFTNNIQPNTNRVVNNSNFQNRNNIFDRMSNEDIVDVVIEICKIRRSLISYKNNIFDGMSNKEIVDVVIELCKVRRSLIPLIRNMLNKFDASNNNLNNLNGMPKMSNNIPNIQQGQTNTNIPTAQVQQPKTQFSPFQGNIPNKTGIPKPPPVPTNIPMPPPVPGKIPVPPQGQNLVGQQPQILNVPILNVQNDANNKPIDLNAELLNKMKGLKKVDPEIVNANVKQEKVQSKNEALQNMILAQRLKIKKGDNTNKAQKNDLKIQNDVDPNKNNTIVNVGDNQKDKNLNNDIPQLIHWNEILQIISTISTKDPEYLANMHLVYEMLYSNKFSYEKDGNTKYVTLNDIFNNKKYTADQLKGFIECLSRIELKISKDISIKMGEYHGFKTAKTTLANSIQNRTITTADVTTFINSIKNDRDLESILSELEQKFVEQNKEKKEQVDTQLEIKQNIANITTWITKAQNGDEQAQFSLGKELTQLFIDLDFIGKGEDNGRDQITNNTYAGFLTYLFKLNKNQMKQAEDAIVKSLKKYILETDNSNIMNKKGADGKRIKASSNNEWPKLSFYYDQDGTNNYQMAVLPVRAYDALLQAFLQGTFGYTSDAQKSNDQKYTDNRINEILHNEIGEILTLSDPFEFHSKNPEFMSKYFAVTEDGKQSSDITMKMNYGGIRKEDENNRSYKDSDINLMQKIWYHVLLSKEVLQSEAALIDEANRIRKDYKMLTRKSTQDDNTNIDKPDVQEILPPVILNLIKNAAKEAKKFNGNELSLDDIDIMTEDQYYTTPGTFGPNHHFLKELLSGDVDKVDAEKHRRNKISELLSNVQTFDQNCMEAFKNIWSGTQNRPVVGDRPLGQITEQLIQNISNIKTGTPQFEILKIILQNPKAPVPAEHINKINDLLPNDINQLNADYLTIFNNLRSNSTNNNRLTQDIQNLIDKADKHLSNNVIITKRSAALTQDELKVLKKWLIDNVAQLGYMQIKILKAILTGEL